MECQIKKAEVVTFNSGNGGTGVSESFEGVSQSDVSSVKRGETVTVQSTVTDEKDYEKVYVFPKILILRIIYSQT